MAQHGRIWEFFHPRQAEREFYRRQDEQVCRDMEEVEQDREYWKYSDKCEMGIQKGNPPDSRALDRKIERAAEHFPDAERAGAEMGQDYYTQPVGSERHRAAHREYLKATGGSMEGWTAEQEYAADNWAELEYDRWQAVQEAMDREDGPESGTSEWHWERGHTDEPDWSKDPAIDPRTGKQYFNDGRVLTWDGRDITHEYPAEPPGPERAEPRQPGEPIDFGPARHQEPEPQPETPGLLRIVPMEKYPAEREVRGETNPYDNWPRYSQYWAPGIEGAE